MKHINLIFGCHSHQPVGNFDFVFEKAYDKAYVPFIDVLERFPAVRVTLHFTGPLWDWFATRRYAYIERLAGLVRSGQIEIMGGGYYEPLLCAIPERDAIAQIQRMQRFCEQHFGVRPKGMWLTERVWEPQMARILAKAGVEYTALDDTHFLCSGLSPQDLFGYYMTEDEGLSIKVFPILERLRYLIPFHQVHESIEFLREHATEDGMACALIHDDGEKFGIWPGTYHSVYEEGWLEEFFQALTDNQEWIHSLTYSDYLAKAKALGRTYLTCASYQEMMAWVLPTPMQRRLYDIQEELKHDPEKQRRYGVFLRGGFWRGFLAKYAESNNLQKRMMRVSNRLFRLQTELGPSPALEEAEKLLHQAQCNCAYWHGVFGGLYLNHLRTAVYEHLIAADSRLDAIEHSNTYWINSEKTDFDGDGNLEAILENNTLALFFSPTDGGTLFELDYKPKPFNFANTLTRREEPYHDALKSGKVQVGDQETGDASIHEIVRAKEAGLENLLIYDPFRRVSLRDHFLPRDISQESLWKGEPLDLGGFPTANYAMEINNHALILSRHSQLEGQAVRLRKTITLLPDASYFEIRYDIETESAFPENLLLGVEFSVNLLTGTAFDRYYRSEDRDMKGAKLGESGCEDALSHIALRDDWQKFEYGMRFSVPARVFRFAIETVSQSEAGQERVYQGSVIMPSWPLAGRCFSCGIRVEIVNTAGR
ncbi:MAG TPA: DUF1926 domain-containing protein [Candidatus Hydrogenedentes bacterium]|mgnify:CR=1 FL=1|nr:DUF1926 domain-containing protein [Candidatus Hydrogenedentota bacterium]